MRTGPIAPTTTPPIPRRRRPAINIPELMAPVVRPVPIMHTIDPPNIAALRPHPSETNAIKNTPITFPTLIQSCQHIVISASPISYYPVRSTQYTQKTPCRMIEFILPNHKILNYISCQSLILRCSTERNYHC